MKEFNGNGAMNFTFQGGFEVEALVVARTIESLVDLATTVSNEKYPDAKIGLSVRAVEKGSLMFEFAAIMQSNPNLLSLQNIQCAKDIIDIMSSAFQIKKFLKGKKPTEKKTENEKLILKNSNGQTMEFPQSAGVYFINSNIDMSVGRVISQAASSKNISGISVRSDTGATVAISRNEFDECEIPVDFTDIDTKEITVTRKREVLFIRKPDFEAKSQWEFSSDRRINANITDESFLEKVKAGKISFVCGAYIVADLAVTLRMQDDGTPSETKCKYTVTKVYEVVYPDDSQTVL